ncbi:ATP-dependent sacrificial sulfur transferase LarE [Flaviflexus massiliensis]|uniref:ATP-dependent sacrificial sulfur transferase LarE n=1 Tax=Flaviflexus massiliensis TaxID=1522309 RepID=UPI0006D5739F|nr:ATP-dependent sacrificial sulfur transferase LarE [Flaviflexus massiliensis]
MTQVASKPHAIDLNVPLPDHLEPLAQAVASEVIEALDGACRPRIGIAYSGGVDSAVLTALVARAVGMERTVLLLGISPSLAARERTLAHRQAAQLGLGVEEIETHEINNEHYRKNDVDRCYFCKDELFSQFDDHAAEDHDLGVIAYGENLDDSKRPDRPGGRAAREHSVLYPLATAGISKAQVREIASAFGLDSALKPAAPCLASRIPHGQEVTAEKLRAVDLAEDVVLGAGFTDCRVRHHGTVARIEVPTAEIARIANDEIRTKVLKGVKAAGFNHVAFDLNGIQSGAFTMQILSRRPEGA